MEDQAVTSTPNCSRVETLFPLKVEPTCVDRIHEPQGDSHLFPINSSHLFMIGKDSGEGVVVHS